jgi:hypothetical protein
MMTNNPLMKFMSLRFSAASAALLAVGLPLIATTSFGDGSSVAVPTTKPQTEQMAAAAPQTTDMRIILVEWRIKKGREKEFLEYWSTRATITDRSGLIGEFLSRVENREQFPWMRWELDERWTTFVNVGLWRRAADFQQNVGRFIDNTRPPMDFEAQPRRRVFVAPERWRDGYSDLLDADHPAVH